MQKPRLIAGVVAALATTAFATAPASAQAVHASPAVLLATSHAPSHTPSQAVAPLDDPTIVAIFDAANTWDIDLGNLALKKSSNKDVRNFADMMVRDHSAARKLGRDLAKKLHVTPTPPGKDFALYKDHVATLAKLNGLTGAAFDKAYIDHEVWYHQAVIDAVTNTLLPATKNAELKDLEVKVAPNFQAHLAAAKDLQKKLGA
jgi:putative membrane protein